MPPADAAGLSQPGTEPSIAYPPTDAAGRESLLAFIRKTPISFGTWRDLKALYKKVEADPDADPQVIGALLARLDVAPLVAPGGSNPTADIGASGVASLAIRDRKLYVLGTGQGTAGKDRFGIYDLDGPDLLKPERLGGRPPRSAIAMVLCGDYACMLPQGGYGGSAIMHMFDVSDPTSISGRGKVDIGGSVARASAVYPYVFLTIEAGSKSFNGLRVVSIADPDNPRVVGEIAIKNAVGTAATPDGKTVVVATGNSGFSWTSLPKIGGVRVVSLEDPTKPRVVGAIDVGNVQSGTVGENMAYIGVAHRNDSEPAGLHLVDISERARPRKVGFWKSPNDRPVTVVTVDRGRAYLATQYGNVSIVDVSDPVKPRTLSEVSASYVAQMAVDGDHLYIGMQWGNGLMVYNVSNPEKPQRAGMPPSAATMGYMKRRARRYLKTLAGKEPARYVEVAYRLLTEAGKLKHNLDTGSQWPTADVLFGGSGRYIQVRHGRGPYKARLESPAPRFRRLASDARAIAAWDARPDLAQDLLKRTNLPWQTQELALGVLLRTKTPLPAFSETVLERFLNSDSAVLNAYAVRQVATLLEGGKEVKAGVSADALLLASGRLRQRMTPLLARRLSGDKKAGEEFVTRVLEVVQLRIPAGGSSGPILHRRIVATLQFVAEHLRSQVSPRAIAPIAAALLETRQPDLIQMVAAGAQRVKPRDLLYWLGNIGLVNDAALREPVLVALEQAMAKGSLDPSLATSLVVANNNLFILDAGWRMILASTTPMDQVRALWTTLLDTTYETPAIKAAMASAAALTLLSKSGIGPEEIAERLKTRPFLVALLSPETFTRITQSVPASVTLSLIAAAPDDLWVRLKEGWLRNLREGIGLTELWTSVPAALEDDAEDRIANRVVSDPDVAKTFADIEAAAAEQLLALREPLLGSLLGAWVRNHESLFSEGSETLLKAATHLLPEVRSWGLDRVRSLGMRMPFALRLLESEVPPSVNLGRTFFEAAERGSREEMNFALALCDSPQKSVRTNGRTYVRARWDTLPRADLYRALFEHPEPDMQNFVATLLEETPTDDRPADAETAEFDRDVLRARNRARRAKEAVKARQSEMPTVDIETLLSLARGAGTPRDAEWALSQLARRALAGEKIEGFAVEGVSGV